jgi:hypothetical protein
MVLWPGVLIGLVVGLLTGGSLLGFSVVRFRLLWLMALAIGAQIVIFTRPVGTWEFVLDYGAYIYMLTIVMTIVFMYYNLDVPGIKLIMIGALLNAATIFANLGYMPVSNEAMRISGLDERFERELDPDTATVEVQLTNNKRMDETTRLEFLGDFIPVPYSPNGPTVISIGDIVIAIGAAVATAKVTHMRPAEDEAAEEAEKLRAREAASS